MNICPICDAALSHHTLGNLVPMYTCTCTTYFPVGQKKKITKKKKKAHLHTDFEADWWPETRGFFVGVMEISDLGDIMLATAFFKQ